MNFVGRDVIPPYLCETAGFHPAPHQLKTKPATEIFRGWWVVLEQTDVFSVKMQATRSGCSGLNKNATDMGTPVAVLTLNQKFWLNCCAETRP
jgi:hypothetical protein